MTIRTIQITGEFEVVGVDTSDTQRLYLTRIERLGGERLDIRDEQIWPVTYVDDDGNSLQLPDVDSVIELADELFDLDGTEGFRAEGDHLLRAVTSPIGTILELSMPVLTSSDSEIVFFDSWRAFWKVTKEPIAINLMQSYPMTVSVGEKERILHQPVDWVFFMLQDLGVKMVSMPSIGGPQGDRKNLMSWESRYVEDAKTPDEVYATRL